MGPRARAHLATHGQAGAGGWARADGRRRRRMGAGPCSGPARAKAGIRRRVRPSGRQRVQLPGHNSRTGALGRHRDASTQSSASKWSPAGAKSDAERPYGRTRLPGAVCVAAEKPRQVATHHRGTRKGPAEAGPSRATNLDDVDVQGDAGAERRRHCALLDVTTLRCGRLQPDDLVERH